MLLLWRKMHFLVFFYYIKIPPPLMELWQHFWMCEKLDQDENFTTFRFWKRIYWMWCTHQNICGKGVTLLSPQEQLHDSEWDGNSHSGLLGWHLAIFQGGTNVIEQNTPSISLRMKAVCFFQMRIPTLKTARCQNPEYHNMNLHDYENLKS